MLVHLAVLDRKKRSNQFESSKNFDYHRQFDICRLILPGIGAAVAGVSVVGASAEMQVKRKLTE